METKKIILLGILGIVAIGAYLQLKKLSTPPSANVEPMVQQVVPAVEYADVLTAAVEIVRGKRITAEQLKWTKWPVEALNDSLIDISSQPTAMEDMVGAVAKGLIVPGEPISELKVVHPGDRSQMAAILRPGMRAISVEINANSAAGGFILPGDRVDIVLTSQLTDPNLTFTQGQNQTIYTSNTIFEDVNVLAVDQIYGQAPDGTASIVGGNATLELSQSDAENIIEAQSRGEISLTLRGINNRDARLIASSAVKSTKEHKSVVTAMTIYRSGQPQAVAVQGQ